MQALQRALAADDNQMALFNAAQETLTSTAEHIIAMEPSIAVEWQPGSIVIYSAWAIMAHSHPGDKTLESSTQKDAVKLGQCNIIWLS